MICPYCGKDVPKETIHDHYNLYCPRHSGISIEIKEINPIQEVFLRYRHLDHRIEKLPEDNFANSVIRDMWTAIKTHLKNTHEG